MTDTPITDRLDFYCDQFGMVVHAHECAELERVANQLAESLETAIALLDGFNMDKERKALAEYEAMKGAT